MPKNKFIVFILVAVLLSSCNKHGSDSQNSQIAGKKVYFDIWGEDKTIPGLYQFNSLRIGYDCESKKIIWQKTNENIEAKDKVAQEFNPSSPPRVSLTESFRIENSLIRIFADRTSSRTWPTHSPVRNGIFLEKIDVSNGSRVSFINLLPAVSLPSGSAVFDISKVVCDGKNFYFGCADGKLYCFTVDGNLVWSKPNYLPKLHSNQFSVLYLNNGKLYYVASNNKINCINSNDGSLSWQIDFESYKIENENYCELSFTNTKMFAYFSLVIYRYSLTNGKYEGSCYSNGADKTIPLPVTLDDTIAFAFNTVNNCPVVCRDIYDPLGGMLLKFIDPPACMVNTMCKSYQKNFFGWGNHGHPTIDFSSLNFYTGKLNWSIRSPESQQVLVPKPEVFDYFFDDGKIYIIGNFYYQDGTFHYYKENEMVGPGFYGYAFYGNAVSLVILDAFSGALIDQAKIFSDNNFSIIHCYRFATD